jgi:hypothetical protein
MQTELESKKQPNGGKINSKFDGMFTIETKHIIVLIFVIFIAVGMFDSMLRLLAIGLLLQSVMFKIDKVPTIGTLVMYLLKKKE